MPRSESDYKQLDDRALVLAVQAGQTRAFEPLVDRHLAHIHAMVALRLPVPHLVDEITHEAFVLAYQRIDQFTAGTNLRGWLRTLAGNLVRTELGRYQREQCNLLSYAEQQEVEHALQEQDEATALEADALRHCLEQVPPQMRFLLELRYGEDQKSGDIAFTLKKSRAWVRVTLHRLRRQLRDCIDSKLEKGPEHA